MPPSINSPVMACDSMWQEGETSKDPQKPLIHTVFSNVASKRRDHQPGSTGHNDRWQIEVPVNLTDTAMAGMFSNGEFAARRIASQAQWLFSSSEREALSVHGVNEMKIERPPVVMPGTSWHMRMLTASCLTRREQAR